MQRIFKLTMRMSLVKNLDCVGRTTHFLQQIDYIMVRRGGVGRKRGRRRLCFRTASSQKLGQKHLLWPADWEQALEELETVEGVLEVSVFASAFSAAPSIVVTVMSACADSMNG